MKFKTNGVVLSLVGFTVVAGGLFICKDTVIGLIFRPTASVIPTKEKTISGSSDQNISIQPELVAENLEIPWEIVFLPDRSLLVTERTGSVVRIAANSRTSIPIQGVVHRGEGGLLGMVLHPAFPQNNWIYLYLTTQSGSSVTNRVERYTFNSQKNELTDRVTVVENIPGSTNHDGGRIAFGPDGCLYITTGDAQNEQNAQNKTSLAGKVLRLKDDGSIPADSSFGNAVYSYGHRNPQGIAWDAQGRLWESEHGPSGTGSGYDEVNLIVKGANYGWPEIQGSETAAGMRTPVIQSGGSETWAPAGLAIVNDTLFFSGLRGESLYSGNITGTELTNLETHFREEYGRLRIVTVSPDGWLYFGTSNTDGRGTQNSGDDKIFRIKVDVLD